MASPSVLPIDYPTSCRSPYPVTAVKGLWVSATPSPTSHRWFPGFSAFNRVVHITAKGHPHSFEEHTDPVPERSSRWSQNMTQCVCMCHTASPTPYSSVSPRMGPLHDSDKVTFRVQRRLPLALPGHSITIATSKEYTLRSLLIMQERQGARKGDLFKPIVPSLKVELATLLDIRIPLKTNHADNVEATLLLQVREPTTTFVSKQWLREANKLRSKMDALQGDHVEEKIMV